MPENVTLLNGKLKVDISKGPKEAAVFLFNSLFANLCDAVSKGKGMANLHIIPAKKMTISNLMVQTFPHIKCFNNAVTPIII